MSNNEALEKSKIPVIGLVSFAAVVHSHLYWVYSVIYIAYHKITPTDNTKSISTSVEWKNGKFIQDKTKPKRIRHARKKSLTNKPRGVVMPAIEARPFAKQVDIHQLIQAQRHLPKRSRSTDLPVLIEDEPRSSEDSFASITSETAKPNKKIMGLIRSTFHRSESLPPPLTTKSSSSSLSDLEVEVALIKHKRNIFGSLRRNRSASNATQKSNTDEEVELQVKKQHKKLFRSLPSWKSNKKIEL